MTKTKQKQNNYNHNKQLIEELKKRIDALEEKNKDLEERFGQLQEKQIITSHVNSMLVEEVDRLNQYTRRSSVVLRNIFAPEKETVYQAEEKAKAIIVDMGLQEVLPDFDKAHRLGKIKDIKGKKHQDIIVRFKSHSSRYKVYNNRKAAKNVRISPHLTLLRNKLLAGAINFTNENINRESWGFVFANEHGDLLVRLSDKYKGKHYFPFNSLDSLADILGETGLLNKE